MWLNRGRLVVIVAVVLAVLAALALLLPENDPEDPGGVRLRPDDRAVVAEGKRIYREQCASCHAADLGGQPNWQVRKPDGKLPAPPHDETGHTWHHPDAVLFALTKYGPAKLVGDPNYQTDMPGYEETLTDAEIVAVLSYIKSTWPPAIRERHDRMNEEARRP